MLKPSDKILATDEDGESDALYSITKTDPIQVAYCELYSLPVSTSFSAPGQPIDKLSETVTDLRDTGSEVGLLCCIM